MYVHVYCSPVANELWPYGRLSLAGTVMGQDSGEWKGVHARGENSNAWSDRPANWQEAVRLHGRRNAVLREVNALVVVKIQTRTGSDTHTSSWSPRDE